MVTLCASGSDNSKEFLPSYGAEWKALMRLPVNQSEAPLKYSVSTKAYSREPEASVKSSSGSREHSNTVPGRKEALPPVNVDSCFCVKANTMMEHSDCCRVINQVAEEEPPCWHHLWSN